MKFLKHFWSVFLLAGILVAQVGPPPPPPYGYGSPYPYSPYYGPGAYPPDTTVVGRPYYPYGYPYGDYSPYYRPGYEYPTPYPYPYPNPGVYDDGNTVWVP